MTYVNVEEMILVTRPLFAGHSIPSLRELFPFTYVMAYGTLREFRYIVSLHVEQMS